MATPVVSAICKLQESSRPKNANPFVSTGELRARITHFIPNQAMHRYYLNTVESMAVTPVTKSKLLDSIILG